MRDTIFIEKLELLTRIGVTSEEREQPQRVTVSLLLEPRAGVSSLADCLEKTVDYTKVCVAVKEIACAGERQLIETLAEEIASELLRRFHLSAVEVEARKFVVPDTAFVGVKIRREAK